MLRQAASKFASNSSSLAPISGPVSRSLFSTAAAAQEYDAVVIGGGPGGYVAAIKAAQLGLKV